MVVLLLLMGLLTALVGYVWILIKAWMDSVPWGVGVLLFSPLALVYGVLKWEDTKVPVIVLITGVTVHLLGQALTLA